MFKNFKNLTVKNIDSNCKLPTQLSENLLKKKIFPGHEKFLRLLQKPFKVLLHVICQTNTCMVFKRIETQGIVFQKPFIGFLGYIQKFCNKLHKFVWVKILRKSSRKSNSTAGGDIAQDIYFNQYLFSIQIYCKRLFNA